MTAYSYSPHKSLFPNIFYLLRTNINHSEPRQFPSYAPLWSLKDKTRKDTFVYVTNKHPQIQQLVSICSYTMKLKTEYITQDPHLHHYLLYFGGRTDIEYYFKDFCDTIINHLL